MFSYVYCKIFTNTFFFTEHLWWLFLHCTGYCLVQSWSKQTKTELCRFFSFKIIAVHSGPILCNVVSDVFGQLCIDQTIFLWNVDPAWLIQHCMGYFFMKVVCLPWANIEQVISFWAMLAQKDPLWTVQSWTGEMIDLLAAGK